MTALKDADLGDLDGPVLVFGGPYSNLEASQALRAEAGRLGIPPARIICTGDVVAYCADPVATVDLIRDWGVAVVMGNCEQSLSSGAADCGCGFAEGTACDLLAKGWYAQARASLNPGRRAWMGGLPHRIRFRLGGVRGVALHGGRDINRFIFASTPRAEKRAEADALNADLIVGGHCGLPFTTSLGPGRAWHNAGAIGLPANDGTAEVWYSLLTPTSDGLTMEHCRLAYDHARAARRMGAAAYRETLETGLWPSLDVLPPEERAATGVRLDLPPYDL